MDYKEFEPYVTKDYDEEYVKYGIKPVEKNKRNMLRIASVLLIIYALTIIVINILIALGISSIFHDIIREQPDFKHGPIALRGLWFAFIILGLSGSFVKIAAGIMGLRKKGNPKENAVRCFMIGCLLFLFEFISFFQPAKSILSYGNIIGLIILVFYITGSVKAIGTHLPKGGNHPK